MHPAGFFIVPGFADLTMMTALFKVFTHRTLHTKKGREKDQQKTRYIDVIADKAVMIVDYLHFGREWLM